jgi:hypothetical protein
MSVCRPIVGVLAGLVCGGLWGLSASADAQSLSAAPGPQQMIPSGAPATYPSTDPSTYPSTYPSTAEPVLRSPTLTPYSSSAAGLTATTPSGGGRSSPATPGELGSPGDRLGSNNSGPLYTPYGSPDAMTASRSLDANGHEERTFTDYEPWTW